MTTEYTDNYSLNLPDFRMGPWHDLINENFITIDSLLYGLYGASWISEAPLDGKLYARRSASWEEIPKITVSDSAPSGPAIGDVWIDSS